MLKCTNGSLRVSRLSPHIEEGALLFYSPQSTYQHDSELIVSCSVHAGPICAYQPVVLMHGILNSARYMDKMAEFITSAHPGTEVLNVDLFNDLVRSYIVFEAFMVDPCRCQSNLLHFTLNRSLLEVHN